MLDIILLIMGIGGFGLASYLDLKYTEFPDWLPYGMIASILLFRAAFSVYYWEFSGLFQSIIFGLGFLVFGLIFYFLKQWGDGDAWLLGVMGFLFPNSMFQLKSAVIPDFLSIIINFFLISFFYIIVYSVAIGWNKPDVKKIFYSKLKGEGKICVILGFVFLLVYSVFIIYTIPFSLFSVKGIIMQAILPVLMVFSIIFFYYAKAVESKLFRKKIKASDLRVGDVIIGSRWKGLTELDVKKLKKKGGHFWIKEGVRFAPVYLITLIVSIIIGSLIF